MLTPNRIRAIDAWCGIPACAALTLCRRLAGGGRIPPPPSGPPRSILFIKLTEQGAMVLASPAIRRAVELVGAENVCFMVFGENRPILDLLGLIPSSNIFEVRTTGLRDCAADLLRVIRALRRRSIDAAVDLEFFSRASAILAFLSGARLRAGHHGFSASEPYRGDLLTHRVVYNPQIHTAASYASLVEALTADAADLPLLKMELARLSPAVAPVYVATEEQKARVRASIDEAAGRKVDSPLIILNPNASDMLPIRKWPQERFVELGRRLLAAHPDATILLTGQAHERDASLGIAKRIDAERCVCLAGRTTMEALVVLYTFADLMVTNDSGPPHFASMTPMHTVVLFGPETPRLFGPLGERTCTLSANLACSPCVSAFNFRQSPCRRNRCMEALSVDQVFAAANQAMRLRSSAG